MDGLCIGVNGWYPLVPPTSHQSFPPDQDQTISPHLLYIGGVEVTATFSSRQDHELVLTTAKKLGWQPPCLLSEISGVGVAKQWEVWLDVGMLWLDEKTIHIGMPPMAQITPLKAGAQMLSYIRYRFFDLG